MDVLDITMNALFDSKELKSWTTHENSHSIVLTLRFSKGSHIDQCDTGNTASGYKKRSQKESERNQDRFKNWKSKQHPMKTRSDPKFSQIEEKRSSDLADLAVSETLPISPEVCDTPGCSTPGLDKSYVHSPSMGDISDSIFCSIEDSPHISSSESTHPTTVTVSMPPEPVETGAISSNERSISESDATCDDTTDGETRDHNSTAPPVRISIKGHSNCTRCEDTRQKLIAIGYSSSAPLVECNECRLSHRKHHRHKQKH